MFIILLGLFFLDYTVVDAVETPSEKRYIQALKQTPLYDLRIPDEPYEVANLIEDAQMEITNAEHELYYQVPWGKTFLYVAKADVQVVTQRTYPNVALQNKETNKSFVPIGMVANLYEYPDEQSAVFAQLKHTYRYPILEKRGNWYVTSIGGRKGYIPVKAVQLDKGVPILVYHHILKREELGKYENVSTTVTDTQFEEQMYYLAQQQFKTITMPELVSYVKGERTLPAKSVAITFDDGLLSTKIYGYPVLQDYQFKAMQYIISRRVEMSGQQFDPKKLQTLSSDDLELMSDVFIYEAHTYNLHNWIDGDSELVNVSADRLTDDLRMNLAQLPTATSFSYPFGRYTDETLLVVKKLGFQSAVTTKIGFNLPGEDVWQLKRQGPSQQTTLADFKKMVPTYD